MKRRSSPRRGVPLKIQEMRAQRIRQQHLELFGLVPSFRPPMMQKYYRNHVRHDRTDYTVFPLGWRGEHRMGGPVKRGQVVECPKCGRRGLTMPGYRQTRQHHGEWMSTMILHFFPPHMVSEMICCLFDTGQAPYATGTDRP